MEYTFTTAKGVTVTCLPIGNLLDKVNAQFVNAPAPPTYEVPTGGGGVETHVHYRRWVEEEETAEDGTTRKVRREQTSLETDEDRAAWADYRRRLSEHNAAHLKAIARLLLLYGIQYPPPVDDTWMQKQRLLGIVIPEDPIERQLHYAGTEVIADASEMTQIELRVLSRSGVDEEVIRQIEATFRRALGRTGGNTAERTQPPANERGLEPVAAVRAGGDGSESAAAPESV